VALILLAGLMAGAGYGIALFVSEYLASRPPDGQAAASGDEGGTETAADPTGTGQESTQPADPSTTTQPSTSQSSTGSGSGSRSTTTPQAPAIIESPHPYAINYANVWTTPVQSGASEIRMRLRRVEVGAGDQITVKDKSGVVIRTFTQGSYRDVWTDWMIGDRMSVLLRSDVTGTAWGFSVDAIEVRTGIGPATGAPAESFHPYAANTRYTWTISRPGARKLKLHFAKLELGAGDMLGLTSAAGETLISFPELTVKENEWTDWHFTDTIRITLLSDYRDFRYGFLVDQVEAGY